MPNHVKTTIKFKNLKSEEDINFILYMIADTITAGKDNDYMVCFTKIIPEPETEDECPEDCLRNEHTRAEKDSTRPWFDWYTWRLKYWNTKWGAYDCYSIIGKSYIRFVFSTAWSPATPIFKKLEVLGYDMEIKYADEDLGNNCGWLEFDSKLSEWQEKGLANPYKFAENLWNIY